jgi:hypothetical protein
VEVVEGEGLDLALEFEVWSWWKLEVEVGLEMGGRMMHETRDRRGRTQQRAGKGILLGF